MYLFNDEATFHNTNQLNRHNNHYWSVENPRWYRQVNLGNANACGAVICKPYNSKST